MQENKAETERMHHRTNQAFYAKSKIIRCPYLKTPALKQSLQYTTNKKNQRNALQICSSLWQVNPACRAYQAAKLSQ